MPYIDCLCCVVNIYRYECGCLFLVTLVDLGQLLQNYGECTIYSGIAIPRRLLRDRWILVMVNRNPQATKRKSGIQDWHLASFVLALLALNVFILVLHISLEGAIAKFEVQKVVSRENPSDEQGVSHTL